MRTRTRYRYCGDVPFRAVQSSFIEIALSFSQRLSGIIVLAVFLPHLDLQQGIGRFAMATLTSLSTRPTAVGKFLIELGRELFGSYRPEKHYMRGPDAQSRQSAGKDLSDRADERDPDFRRR